MKKIFASIISLLLVSCAGLIPPAEAEVTRFGWAPVTTQEDGTPVVADVYYHMYCNDLAPHPLGLGIDDPMEPGKKAVLINSVLAGQADGKYDCTFTAFYNFACAGLSNGTDPAICESPRSNTLTVWKRNDTRYFTGTEPKMPTGQSLWLK